MEVEVDDEVVVLVMVEVEDDVEVVVLMLAEVEVDVEVVVLVLVEVEVELQHLTLQGTSFPADHEIMETLQPVINTRDVSTKLTLEFYNVTDCTQH